MELKLPISTSLCTPYSSRNLCSPNLLLLKRRRFFGRLNCNSKRLPVEFNSEKETNSATTEKCLLDGENIKISFDRDSNGKHCDFVEVIGIGSRKDAVLDFCLNSPLCSQALRFWNIVLEDSDKVRLQQRSFEKEISSRTVEPQSIIQSCSKAVILLASTAYGSDHIVALDILKTAKSSDKLIVGIILKPFSFEGQRRQKEVKDVVDKLQHYTNICIFIDTDALLEKHLVTLDEALTTANNAVLMATNAISILISDLHVKHLHVPHHKMEEVKASELAKIFESYTDARIGFGTGCNIRVSIVRAVYDCPFIGSGVKQFNGTIVCIIESSGVVNSNDVCFVVDTFRQTTEWKGDIVVSVIDKPSLEPGLIVASIITQGCSTSQKIPRKSSIFSRMARHFPFIFNILKKHQPQEDACEDYSSKNPSFEFFSLQDADNMPHSAEDACMNSTELETLSGYNSEEIHTMRDDSLDSEQRENEHVSCYGQNSEGTSIPILERKQLIGRKLGNVYPAALECASDGMNGSLSASVLDSFCTYRLPVGVKAHSEDLKDTSNESNSPRHSEKKNEDNTLAISQLNSSSSKGAFTDAGFEAIEDFSYSTSMSLKGQFNGVSKQGVLSSRAASVLEADRGSHKRWSPILQMKYRGGIYKGRCQGGLPEGKGRLFLADGNIYDGMWHYGKRSGLGTLYFNNGDVFQGSWRDDVMHGKGWFYFHTGDRWFVNFWKGKANGEGRFYSKLGDIFFGHFKDGWRDGQFICINVNGARYLEIWNKGVLVTRKQLEPNAASS